MYNNYHGIMFHHFYNEIHPKGQGAISAEELSDLINFIKQNYKILPAKEWMEKAKTNSLSSTDICFTFDDGLLCQYDIALPVLDYFSITGFWFIYTSIFKEGFERIEAYRKFRTIYYPTVEEYYEEFFSIIEKSPYRKLVKNGLLTFIPSNYLKEFPFYTDNDRKFRFIRDVLLDLASYNDIMDHMIKNAGINIIELSKNLWMDEKQILQLHHNNHIIGLHSHTHPTTLEYLSLNEQKNEFFQNHKMLTDILGTEPRSMSHPCNSYNESTLKILNELGIEIGFRANTVKMNHTNLELPRQDHINVVMEMKQ